MELSGVLHQVGNIVNKEGKDGRIFSSRSFILKYALENRDQFIKFILEPPNLNIIEKFEIGHFLIVKFNLMGLITKSVYNTDETVVFERKIVTEIKLDTRNSALAGRDIRLNPAPKDGYVGPDLTKDFSRFPDHIAF